MADLSNDVALRFRRDRALRVEKWTCDNTAAYTFYRGQPVIIDADVDAVYVVPFNLATTLTTATDVFVGICLEHKTVAIADTETDNVIEVVGPGSVVGFPASMHSLTNVNVGTAVGFDPDSGTIAALVIAGSATGCPIGHVYIVEDGYLYVKLWDAPIRTAF